jgi:hypothetical protein
LCAPADSAAEPAVAPDTTPDAASDRAARARTRFAEAFAVYLKPRVLVVLFLGFSAGLPLALSGSTLLVWMREAGVDLGTIGLFALVGTPYTLSSCGRRSWTPSTCRCSRSCWAGGAAGSCSRRSC